MIKKPIITTSWDDALNMKLIKLLKKYNLEGTFYIPLNQESRKIHENDIRKLSEDFEIGAHTLNHEDLTKISLDDAKREILYSKNLLEEIIGNKIQMFCYPKGYYNKEIIQLVRKAGYIGARTTEQYRIDVPKDPFRMWTTVHFSPPSNRKYFGNIIRYRNLYGLKHIRQLKLNLVGKSKYYFDYVCKNSGIFHLWGHSWEIEKYNLWSEMEDILKYISNKKNVIYIPNGAILQK